jgi:hypothetical protein
MCDGSSATMQHKGTKWVIGLFVLLVCLIEIQYMIIDLRLKANLQLLESAVRQISLLDSVSLPKSSPHLQDRHDGPFSEELLTGARNKTFLRQSTQQQSVEDFQQAESAKTTSESQYYNE